MAAKVAPSMPIMAPGQHTSGIFADMTVDGPEIGTLVAIVDRAKNLPNRKAMGKQNPYCAARLGKEARKTETDRRGGQTPRWDQELRFTVHDSLDYHNLKISVFSEDKKTDLIGEAWVNLDNVITAGGGKNDMWQTLNFKGKYAGEIRMELTYYDSRPKPDRKTAIEEEAQLRQSSAERVKRRPLPTNPNAPLRTGLTPDTIPQPTIPGRARLGPRELSAPQRANSLPLEPAAYPTPHQPAQQSSSSLHTQFVDANLPIPVHTEYEEKFTDVEGMDDPYTQADFLPSLPPAPRQRMIAAHERYGTAQARPVQPPTLQHSHSDPLVLQYPQYHDEPEETGLYTAGPEPLQDLDYQHQYVQQRNRRSDVALDQHQEHVYPPQRHYPTEAFSQTPPQPPSHSRSNPALPTLPPQQAYATPPAARPVSKGQQYVSTASPLQSIERNRYDTYETPLQARGLAYSEPPQTYQSRTSPYADSSSPQMYHSRDQSDAVAHRSRELPAPHTHDRSPVDTRMQDGYGRSEAPQQAYSSPPQQHHGRSLAHGSGPSPQQRASAGRPAQAQYRSAPDTYGSPATRQSPHPLSQELPRARSPAFEMYTSPAAYQTASEYHQELNRQSMTAVVKPRAISPSRQPDERSEWRRKNTYSIQSPIRAFESSDDSPLSRSVPQTSNRSTPRKSVSPHPPPTQPSYAGGVPFGPDSFDVHNPTIRETATEGPYDPGYNEGSKKTITGWDGREIDPSDHLPVTSWAPEPEIKAQVKSYGQGRDRDFGPRTADPAGTRLSKDTMVNVRRRGQSTDATPSSTIRARLVKKSAPSSPITPLGEHANYNPIPDPYAQQEYSRGFTNGNAGIFAGQKSSYEDQSASLAHARGGYENGHSPYTPPNIPPKVPFGYSQDSYGQDALSREIASIDIGSAPRSRTQAPVAYAPVRSHKDRNSFY